jgi:hypothetical protein
MNQRQHLFSKITILRVTKIYVVLLCITITETFANEAYLEGFSLKVENVDIINIDNVRTKQQTVITVKVVDEKGDPISRVTVLIKGTSRKIITDFDRNYSLDVEDSNSILVDDFNNDQKKDILLLGNLYSSEVEIPRNDISYDYLLKGKQNSQFEFVSNKTSGLWEVGDVKDAAFIKAGASKAIFIARNNGKLSLIKMNK